MSLLVEQVYTFYNRREEPRLSPAILDLCAASRSSLQPDAQALAAALADVHTLEELCSATGGGTCSVGVVRRCLRSMYGAVRDTL